MYRVEGLSTRVLTTQFCINIGPKRQLLPINKVPILPSLLSNPLQCAWLEILEKIVWSFAAKLIKIQKHPERGEYLGKMTLKPRLYALCKCLMDYVVSRFSKK